MTDDLLFLRALVVSPEESLCGLFRQAASASSTPMEIVEAADAASAFRSFADGADLAYIDGALPKEQIIEITSALRARAKPPFTVLLGAGAAAPPFATDGLAGKPSRSEEAQWLVERSMRVRLPSRVLIVDDSKTMRSIVRKTLAATRFPFDMSEADEGFAAVKLVRESEFDIVFLDYNMPGFSGLETLSEFKREKRSVTVVMITSTQDEALEERARALGAAFLRKPFFPADIEAVLCRFYGLRALNPKRA
jgi:DNA-binding response OmpR family regulator